ncbi:hypothetical protein ABZX74_15400 [Streptomyces olivaceoviridis]|uniref:hypothetical protein n=1 Tax=Streptomyces olivaceoviridis TaxID=1921 RepID=UPI0033BAD8EB
MTTTDFYEPGYTYAKAHGWKFRVDMITTHPADGEKTALGWRYFRDDWEPYEYGPLDWQIHQQTGFTEITKTEFAR